jgi:hypothetical protein
MEGDSDDEGTDDDGEWPSAALDRGKSHGEGNRAVWRASEICCRVGH